MNPRYSHIAANRAPVAPMHRGPQATNPNALNGPLVHAPNAALLIDFDNVTMGIRSDLQTELRNLLSSDIIHGKVAVQRAYADWRRYPQYIVPLSEASIDLIFAPAYGSSKKNATDIRLAIDAMELVFTRPEIGTIILLSGDSDFSSLVIKLKEYGKYVIGVGIRESSSDLLVQNCDEYYSYNALAGLVKSGDEPTAQKYDPWELVTESINRMQRNGDVMRSDRLKQVMQEIDSTFDEKNLGFSKFSKFCLDASQKGLLHVTKLDNGQLDVAPPAKGGVAAKPAAATATADGEAPTAIRTAAPLADGEERERSGRRGRRGGRGRSRREREETPLGTTAERAVAAQNESAAVDAPMIAAAPTAAPAVVAEAAPAPQAAPAPSAAHAAAPRAEARPPRNSEPRTTHTPKAGAPKADASIGLAGIRLTRDEAFDLVRKSVAALVSGDDSVPSERVREKAFALLGRDSESLSEKNFARIMRDAHDGDVIDLRKRGDAFEVATAAQAPSVADQLNVKEAALKAASDKEKAANAPIVPRGMGPRGAPPKFGSRGMGGKTNAPPPDFLMIGVVGVPAKPAATVAVLAPVIDEAPTKGKAKAKSAAPKAKAEVATKTAPKAKAATRAKKTTAKA
jgi:uncharacterized protein (TIGR00288 family)